MANYLIPADYEELIERALEEDLGTAGDVTSLAIFKDESGEAVLLSKEAGILAGSGIFEAVYGKIDPSLKIRFDYADGDRIAPMEKVAFIEGRIASILKGERVSLNFISFLSGIATKAAKYVAAAKSGGNAVILDTRKTLPGYRSLSKYAVTKGGAQNHRMGLFDLILIKDNHVDACGGITNAIDRVRNRWGSKYKIEVECRTIDDVKEALEGSVDIIMLDNMDTATMKKAVGLCTGKVKLEASGNIDLGKVAHVSSLGVDYISAGSITKSAESLDFSIDIEK